MDQILSSNVEGIYASDQIPHNISTGKFYIINSDPADSSGKHWVSIFFPPNSLPEFFDSLGKCPSFYSYYIVESLIKYNPQGFIHNYKRIQSKYSCCCGVYCLFYIYFRCENVSFQDILRKFGGDFQINDNIIMNFFGF